tara:strand:- start:2250 stop:2969 length:720 start_codon:yes stop_codon:yes gene_type:complete
MISLELFDLGSFWKLQVAVNGYKSPFGNELVTQASSGRSFEIILPLKVENGILSNSSRIKVRLLEDGYECWLNLSDIINNICNGEPLKESFLNRMQINNRIPHILDWLSKSSNIPNQYLWGGTIGPDFDCSGLVQTAFSSQGVWLPRDAYQQENFCEKFNDLRLLLPGDLLFFGSKEVCNHVAIYNGNNHYWHSSGTTNGNNGIGLNHLQGDDSVSSYYQSLFRCAGRVNYCHDGTTLN